MKIALIGYGKMGKAIEQIAVERQHEIVLKIDLQNVLDFTEENMLKVDVAIEFTSPRTAYENIKKCLEFGVPVISGSTGWLQNFDNIQNECLKRNGSFLYASNFSVGVNLFFEINKYAAALMSKHREYNISINEIHHTQKKDAPSGTAITLAEQIMSNNFLKEKWVNEITSNSNELQITSERIDPAPGTHSVKYSSAIDDIEIVHTAHNRIGFATGAVIAAEFIYNKKGIFTMKDVLGF